MGIGNAINIKNKIKEKGLTNYKFVKKLLELGLEYKKERLAYYWAAGEKNIEKEEDFQLVCQALECSASDILGY